MNAKRQPLRSCEDICVFYQRQATYNPQMREGATYIGRVSDKNLSSECYGSAKIHDEIVEYNGRYPVTALEFSRDKEKLHPTQKPVSLMEYLIRTYTNEGETVMDNCMGSGTAGVACMNTGRRFIGIEMDAGYFQIAQGRIMEAAATATPAAAKQPATND